MKFTHELSSELQSLGIIDDIMQAMVKEKGSEFASHDKFVLRLILFEGVTNAMRHGNKLDPSKKVHVFWELNFPSLWIKIQDEGNGFDVDSIQDPTDDSLIHKEGGRGVFLLQEYCENMQYHNSGTFLELTVKFKNE